MNASEGELLRDQLARLLVETYDCEYDGTVNTFYDMADALLRVFDVRLREPQAETPANDGERHAVEALLGLMRTPREERVMPPADDTDALTERLHASVIEVFRKALMIERHDDWTMETVSEAAHICADALLMETLPEVHITALKPDSVFICRGVEVRGQFRLHDFARHGTTAEISDCVIDPWLSV